MGLAFKLYDPDHILGDQDELGITLGLIPTRHTSVEIGRRHKPLHVPFQNGPIHGNNVFIPLDWVIGGREQIGHGWRMLMECLSDGRGISLPALSTGAAKLASRTCGAYARVRQQFNISIGEFEGIQERLARIAGLTYMMDSARMLILNALDTGEKPSVLSAVVKYHLTECMRTVVNDAMDVHGGKGIMLGEKNYLANIYEAVPIGITVEGANILTRNMIIFGQGAIRCHPYVLSEMKAASCTDLEHGISAFDDVIYSHVGFTLSNSVRTLLLGLSNGRLHQPPVEPESRRYCQELMRMSAAFALLVDLGMMLIGGKLKRKERLSARLGDIFSYLYLATACLRHFERGSKSQQDISLMNWCLDYSLFHIQEAIHGFLANFPNRIIATIVKLMIFPFGRSYQRPADKLDSAVATILTTNSGAREQLTTGLFMPAHPSEPLALLENAFQQVLICEPLVQILKKFAREQDIRHRNFMETAKQAWSASRINEEEYNMLCNMLELSEQVIAVDDFNADELANKTALWNEKTPAIMQ